MPPETARTARRAGTRLPVFVDTDGGIDDVAALWYLLDHPQVELVGISIVWGNVGLEQAGANVCRVLAAAGRPDVPVALGTPAAFGPAPEIGPATGIHGRDGLGEVGMDEAPFGPGREPASDLLVRSVSSRPGEVTLLTLGPLSNVALVLDAEPGFARAVGSVVVMGGSARVGGNALPSAEANIAHDPEAAAAVVLADWAAPPHLVGLDATLRATLRDSELDLAREERTAAASFLAAPLAFYAERGGAFCEEGTFPCHDLLAAVSITDPAVVDEVLVPLGVDTGGSAAWGATIVDTRPWVTDPAKSPARGNDTPAANMARWRVALGADADLFRRRVRELFGDSPGEKGRR